MQLERAGHVDTPARRGLACIRWEVVVVAVTRRHGEKRTKAVVACAVDVTAVIVVVTVLVHCIETDRYVRVSLGIFFFWGCFQSFPSVMCPKMPLFRDFPRNTFSKNCKSGKNAGFQRTWTSLKTVL